MRGVHLAVASEVEIGRTFAEARLKTLTGGDRLQGRFMRQDFFEFEPRFKLLIAGNHRPALRGVDEAIRRRLHLIPFTVTIPEGERDPKLGERLRTEWPAILRWAVDGALAWRRSGLAPPDVVRDASAEYLAAEDALTLWMDEYCERDPNAWASSAELFGSWKVWAEERAEYVGSAKRFASGLQDRGLIPAKSTDRNAARGFRGLRLVRRRTT